MTFSSCSNDDDDSQVSRFKTNLIGKWKTVSIDGKAMPTNESKVYTFNVDGTLLFTAFMQYGKVADFWLCGEKGTYQVTDNSISATTKGIVVGLANCTVGNDLLQSKAVTVTAGVMSFVSNNVISKKVLVDYSKDIIGLWEGVEMTGEETYGGALDHRWEYRQDGTYVYYVKDNAGQYQPKVGNTDAKYFVDGDYLGSRWKNNGVQCQEWWDIVKCDSTEMLWTATRLRADSTTYVTTFKMKRIK